MLPQKKDSLVRSPLGEVSEHRTVACLFLQFFGLVGFGNWCVVALTVVRSLETLTGGGEAIVIKKAVAL